MIGIALVVCFAVGIVGAVIGIMADYEPALGIGALMMIGSALAFFGWPLFAAIPAYWWPS